MLRRPNVRVSLGLLLALATSAVGLARCGTGGGGLSADPPSLHFGRVIYRDRAEATLRLRNDSDHSIFIARIEPNCACFEVLPFQRVLDAGATREVRVAFDSVKVPPLKLIGKKLEIFTDDRNVPPLVVPLEGDPFATHQVSPKTVQLGLLEPDRAARAVVEVRPEVGVELEVDRVQVFPPDVLSARLTSTQPPFLVEVSVEPSVARGSGRLQGRVSFDVRATLPDGVQRRFLEAVPVEGDWP